MNHKRWKVSKRDRKGAALVETAVCLPVFFMFLFGLFEFGYAWMVVNSLNNACRKAARYGVSEQITTAQVVAKVNDLLNKSIDATRATVFVKDASVFDNSNVNPNTINYSNLSSIELSNAEPRQLFLVRVEVPYEDVAILPPFWVTNATLKGQSVMRHE
jgi:Flp pilus assembly protein TadG